LKPQYFLLLLLVGVLFFLIQLFNPFLKSIIVALLLTIATSSIYQYISFRIKNNILTTAIVTFILTVIFFMPILYFIFTFANYINSINQQAIIDFYDQLKVWVLAIPDTLEFIKIQLHKILDEVDIAATLTDILSIGANIGKNYASFMVEMVMILIFYFFFNLYSKELSLYFKELLPLKLEDSDDLFFEVSNVMSVVFYTILITAIFEGLLFGLFIKFFGYDGILLGVLYGFASLIPVVGGFIMWFPLFLYEIFNGNFPNAIFIAFYTIIVISIIADTIIKPILIKYINKKIVKTPARVNELLIFFSIVAGLSTFGFWGMIIGPALVTFFISILQLIKRYSKNLV